MKKYLLPLLLLAACKTGSIETIENRDDKGQILEKFDRRKKDFAKEGQFQAFYPNGTIKEEAFYQNDTLTGEHKFFYPNGTCEIVQRRQNGLFEGHYQHFYDNGTLESEGDYRNNAMVGPWRFLYKNGVVKELVEFRDNEENGPFREFYQSGTLKTEGAYLNGDNEDGPLKMYDSLGVLVKTMDCQAGVCRTVWEKK